MQPGAIVLVVFVIVLVVFGALVVSQPKGSSLFMHWKGKYWDCFRSVCLEVAPPDKK
jgi:hypothetical protein